MVPGRYQFCPVLNLANPSNFEPFARPQSGRRGLAPPAWLDGVAAAESFLTSRAALQSAQWFTRRYVAEVTPRKHRADTALTPRTGVPYTDHLLRAQLSCSCNQHGLGKDTRDAELHRRSE